MAQVSQLFIIFGLKPESSWRFGRGLSGGESISSVGGD